MDDELKQAFAAINKRFDQIDERFNQTDERIHDVETKLLRAFMGWGRTTDAKLRSLPLIEERLSGFEERLGELERKNLERGL